jgi:hypothetical protein
VAKEITMKPKYVKCDGHPGPHYIDGCCVRCGKSFKNENIVVLELNNLTSEYYTPGEVPEDQSQGTFEFGATCAAILLARSAKL